MDSKRDLRQMK